MECVIVKRHLGVVDADELRRRLPADGGAAHGARQSALSGQRLVAIRFDSTRITLRDSVASMQARFEYALESPTGTRTTSKGTATEVFVREHGHWVNPFWYLE